MLYDGIIQPEKLAPSERAAYFHGLTSTFANNRVETVR